MYITSHKAPTLAGAFSWDGQLAASGSADTTIRVRMICEMDEDVITGNVLLEYKALLMLAG